MKALRRSNLATSDKSVQVTSLDKVQEFDFIAVAVPLASLKSGTIRFTGDCEASIEKQNAIDSIQMPSGGKVHALMKWNIDLEEKLVDIDHRLMQGIFICPQETHLHRFDFAGTSLRYLQLVLMYLMTMTAMRALRGIPNTTTKRWSIRNIFQQSKG